MKGTHTTCSLIVGTLLIVGLTSALVGEVNATVTTASGMFKKFQAVTADDTGNTTTSTTLVQVSDMTVTFTTKSSGPMVVQFCAVVNDGVGGPDGNMKVAAQVDGVNIPPGEVDFANHTEVIDSRCFMWVAVDVLAGPHTVRMMWRTFNGNPVRVDQRNMLVQYKR